jgi:hypothetical protein
MQNYGTWLHAIVTCSGKNIATCYVCPRDAIRCCGENVPFFPHGSGTELTSSDKMGSVEGACISTLFTL